MPRPTGPHHRVGTSLAALLAATLVTACAGVRPDARPITIDEASAILDAQRAAWNDGDLRGFMAGYWNSPDLTFVGSSGLTRGFEPTLARYLSSYPDAASRGTLTFELVEVRPLGLTHALVIGRWMLERDDAAEGWFSLVLERRPEGVRIVHDHSS